MSIEMVKLKNGSTEPHPTVVATMVSLKSQAKDGLGGMLLLYDLQQICKGKGERVNSSTVEKLKKLALLEQSGQPHDSVRNIVLSALQGEGLGMEIVSPIA